MVSTEGEEDNLMETLHSLKSHLSATEYSDIVIVVSFDGDPNAAILQRIKGDFQNELDTGLIQVIYPTVEFLREVNREPLGWGSIASTSDNFKKNTSDFNKRLTFLFEYCSRMSENYLHLTYQARAIKPYFPVIKQIIDNFEGNNLTFYAHHIGENNLPGLGRLYSGEMLKDLAEYCALFTGGRLPFEIMDVHSYMRTTVKVTDQRMGDFAFRMGRYLRGAKPEVQFKTTGFKFEGTHGLEKAFNEKEGFTWLQTPKEGDSFTMEFKEPLRISRVLIATGSPLFRDTLTSTVLMACGTDAVTKSCDESQCIKIGNFVDPILDAKKLENVISFPTKCLKLEVTSEIKHWVIIREISIWAKEYK